MVQEEFERLTEEIPVWLLTHTQGKTVDEICLAHSVSKDDAQPALAHLREDDRICVIQDAHKVEHWFAKSPLSGDATWKEIHSYLLFLDEIRDSGKINMFGAPGVMQAMFDMSKKDAMAVVTTWMDTYTLRHPR